MDKGVIFGMRDREYPAMCENVQSQGLEPANGDPEERCNLKLSLNDVTPYDLKDSRLLRAAFIETTAGVQTSLDSAIDPSDPEALFNCRWEVMQLVDGTRRDEDCIHKVQVFPHSGELARNIGAAEILRPQSGIVLKKIKPSENQNPTCPTVDLELMVKGMGYMTSGYGWRYSSFGVKFVNKSADELNEEEEAKRKEKKNPDQPDLPMNAGSPLDLDNLPSPADPEDPDEPGSGDLEDQPQDEELVGESAAVEAGPTFAMVGVKGLNALKPGMIVKGKFASYIRRTGGSAGFESQEQKATFFSAAQLIEKHRDETCVLYAGGKAQVWA